MTGDLIKEFLNLKLLELMLSPILVGWGKRWDKDEIDN